jgi:hypothetical protein
MRGVKIGNKRGAGSQLSGMAMFEMRDKKKMASAASAQKIAEEAIKATTSNESLGLTSIV